ncbi:MAG: hypothetical protein AAF289_07825 [Cyanobacteria bacterium P01_A01_bin.135]
MMHFAKSLLIAGLLGCSMPSLLIGAGLLSVLIIGHIPIAESICQFITVHIIDVLQVFGSGSLLQGIAVISVVIGGVGMLFSTYNLLSLSRPTR